MEVKTKWKEKYESEMKWKENTKAKRKIRKWKEAKNCCEIFTKTYETEVERIPFHFELKKVEAKLAHPTCN